MALVVESTSSVTDNNASSLTLTKPTGVAEGDLLLMFVATNVSGATSTGFTSILSETNDGAVAFDVRVNMLYKIADSGDVSASNYTISSAANQLGAAVMLRVSGWGTGNPLYTSDTFTASSDGTLVVNESGTFNRPSQQLLIMFGAHVSAENYMTYGSYQVTSADSNPSWTEIDGLDFASASNTYQQTLFVSYAVSTDTSDITAWGLTTGNFLTGGADGFAFGFGVIASPQSAAGTTTLLEPDTGFFAPTAEVGTTGTNTLLEPTTTLPSQSGLGYQPTVWTPTNKS